MHNKIYLKQLLERIDARGYKAYKDIQGEYDFGEFILFIDNVQGDPFASPTMIRIRVGQDKAQFPYRFLKNKTVRIALSDFVTRQINSNIIKIVKGKRGTGNSGIITCDNCGQEILERTSVIVNTDFIEARLFIGLPARGRRIVSKHAEQMLFDEIPKLTNKSLLYENLDKKKLEKHVQTYEDQEFIREYLKKNQLVCFISDGSILARQSGISDKPMDDKNAVSFHSPSNMRISIMLPNTGMIQGMGIPKGITLIVGGGYHGKSTLLRAIERGVYNHIPGDGREFVITLDDAVKIRAEDGRRVEKVNISAFINNLPNGQDTKQFSTENASGSTSQAANIIEALEIGTSLLLLDEDTSATNFMIRDGRMQKLVNKDKEPIIPFIDRVRQLYNEKGVSTILVVGGSGDYFDVADRVIMMDCYRPFDVTKQAKNIAQQCRNERLQEVVNEIGEVTNRIPLPYSLEINSRKKKVKTKGLNKIQYGKITDIDLSAVEQLVDTSQTAAIAAIFKYALKKYIDGKNTLKQVIHMIIQDIEQKGLDVISPFYGKHPGNLAKPRPQEIAFAFNRLRILEVTHKKW